MGKKERKQRLSRQDHWINFTPKEIKRLLEYYVVVLLIALIWIVFSVLYHFEISKCGFSDIEGIFMFACPGGLLGAVIYYIRKLYKSCLQGIVEERTSNDNDSYVQKIGAKMYFYLRPIISGILAILLDMGVVSGLYLVTNEQRINNERFFLFVILISFYVGFCNGRIIVNMERRGAEIIGMFFDIRGNRHGEKGK